MTRTLPLLAVLTLLGGCAGAGNGSGARTLNVGDELLFAPKGFARTTEWHSTQPSIVELKGVSDERGAPQIFLIAKRPGRAVIEPVGNSRARVVGPTEVILNQSAFNNRMAGPPPETRQRFTITVE